MLLNLDEEIRCGYKVSTNMKQIWLKEIEMLQELLNICDKNGLRCWVDSGTLLGTVRHKGFIPWDDDVDVIMLRNDYDKLVQIGPSEFKEPFFFQSVYSDKDYYRSHVQIRNSKTTAVRPTECKRKFNQGIFIDIFPLDGMPDDEKEIEILKQTSILMRRKLKWYHQFQIAKRLNILANWWEHYKIDKEIDAVSFESYFRSYEDMFRANRIEDCRYLTYLAPFPEDWKIDKHIFDETLYMDFEGIKVPVPGGYDLYLKTMYGNDYMTPRMSPSEHGDLIFDTQHSYVDTLPAIRRKWRKEGWRRLWNRFILNRKVTHA